MLAFPCPNQFTKKRLSDQLLSSFESVGRDKLFKLSFKMEFLFKRKYNTFSIEPDKLFTNCKLDKQHIFPLLHIFLSTKQVLVKLSYFPGRPWRPRRGRWGEWWRWWGGRGRWAGVQTVLGLPHRRPHRLQLNWKIISTWIVVKNQRHWKPKCTI